MIDEELNTLVQTSMNIYNHTGYVPRDLDVKFKHLNHNLVIACNDNFVEPYLNWLTDSKALTLSTRIDVCL